MKTLKISIFCLSVFLMSVTQITAQKSSDASGDKDLKVERLTLMEQFAPDLVDPLDERVAKKDEREKEIDRKIAILDTLDISDRRKKKLLRDVKFSPFSDRVDKAIIVNTTFEDDVDN